MIRFAGRAHSGTGHRGHHLLRRLLRCGCWCACWAQSWTTFCGALGRSPSRSGQGAVRARAGAISFAAWVGSSDPSVRLAAEARRLMDADVKATGLKDLQGLLWEEGYHGGRLRLHLCRRRPGPAAPGRHGVWTQKSTPRAASWPRRSFTHYVGRRPARPVPRTLRHHHRSQARGGQLPAHRRRPRRAGRRRAFSERCARGTGRGSDGAGFRAGAAAQNARCRRGRRIRRSRSLGKLLLEAVDLALLLDGASHSIEERPSTRRELTLPARPTVGGSRRP